MVVATDGLASKKSSNQLEVAVVAADGLATNQKSNNQP